MFELLSDIQSVPIDQDSLTMVHRGMNKVRVSVGDHISEPSEVYIITGQVNGNFETYVIFYMLEPEIRVVYGCDKNPFPEAMKEQVIEEAIIFVEEMGSILEEIPWEGMTSDQREAWIEKEILYSEPVIEELEEVQEIEEYAVEEEERDEETEFDAESGFVEVSEDELQQALDESASGESPDEISEMASGEDLEEQEEDKEEDDDGADEDDSDALKDVVVAEGDFDELLKQAFLKPDVAEKTKRKKTRFREEEPPAEEIVESDNEEFPVDEELEVSPAGLDTDLEETMEVQEEVDTAASGRVDSAHVKEGYDEVFAKANETLSLEKENRLKVVRFLSRF